MASTISLSSASARGREPRCPTAAPRRPSSIAPTGLSYWSRIDEGQTNFASARSTERSCQGRRSILFSRLSKAPTPALAHRRGIVAPLITFFIGSVGWLELNGLDRVDGDRGHDQRVLGTLAR